MVILQMSARLFESLAWITMTETLPFTIEKGQLKPFNYVVTECLENMPDGYYEVKLKRVKKKGKLRTLLQNSSMWLYFTKLGKALNDAGLDMRKVLKPEVEIPWTKDSVHQFLWLPIQGAMYKTESTTDLETDQVSKVYDVLNRHTGEKLGVSVLFPSIDGLRFEQELKERAH